MPSLGHFLNSQKSQPDFLNSGFLNSGPVLYGLAKHLADVQFFMYLRTFKFENSCVCG